MIFWIQWKGELKKMFSRKRTYIGFGAFLIVETAILGLLQLPSAQRSLSRVLENGGFVFEDYYSGLTLAFLMMTNTLFFLGSLYLALVGGDVVAKEVEDGTLRMTLSRPVSRWRIMVLKYASLVVYTLSLMTFVTLTSLLIGIAYQGWGPLFIYAPLQGIFSLLEPEQAAWRFVLNIPLLACVTMTISSLAFLFSCLKIKPAAASILALSIFFLDMVLQLMPYFKSIHPWLLTHHMSVWVHLFQDPIPWWKLAESLFYLLGFNATFFLVGAALFQIRDFKS